MVRQQRQGLDRLRRRQQARRPRPVRRPAVRAVGCGERRHLAHRTLGQVALRRGETGAGARRRRDRPGYRRGRRRPAPGLRPGRWRPGGRPSGSAITAVSVIASTPKPGSTVSSRSHSSRVSRPASRTGLAVPTRIASIRSSTRWNRRSSRRAPRPLASSIVQSASASSPVQRASVSAAPIGSAKARRTWSSVRREHRRHRLGQAADKPGRGVGRAPARTAAPGVPAVAPPARRCGRSRGA